MSQDAKLPKYYKSVLKPAEIETLERFLKTASEIGKRRYVQDRAALGLDVASDKTGVRVEARVGDEEDFRSSMLDLRKLLADKEPQNLNKVAKAIKRAEHLHGNAQRLDVADKSYKAYRDEMNSHSGLVRADAPGPAPLDDPVALAEWMKNAPGLTSMEVLNAKINAELFHGDPEALKGLPDLDSPGPRATYEFVVHDAAETVIQFANWACGFIESAPSTQLPQETPSLRAAGAGAEGTTELSIKAPAAAAPAPEPDSEPGGGAAQADSLTRDVEPPPDKPGAP